MSADNRRYGLFSITSRFLFLTGSLVAALVLTIVLYLQFHAQRVVEAEIKAEARRVQQNVAARVSFLLDYVEDLSQQLASYIQLLSPDRRTLHSMLQEFVAQMSSIAGASVVFEPYALDPQRHHVAVSYYRRDLSIWFNDLTSASNAYWQSPWYRQLLATHWPHWSEPLVEYSDRTTRLLITHTVPLFRNRADGGREFVGGVRVTLSLEGLRDFIGDLGTHHPGYAVLVSPEGAILSHPDKSFHEKNLFTWSEHLKAHGWTDMLGELRAGSAGVRQVVTPWDQVPAYVSFGQLADTGFQLLYVFPEKTAFADFRLLSARIIGASTIGLLITLLALALLTYRMTHPIRQLSQATRQIAAGQLDAPLPRIKRRDEIGSLAVNFRAMRKSLRKHIVRLRESTAEQMRHQIERRNASQIQHAMLPETQAYLGDPGRRVRIAAVLQPAKGIGGDLFDYFMIDESHLLIVVGDVSDKGIPAALFMSRTVATLRLLATKALRPEVILKNLNLQLCQKNDEYMFVTMFCAVLNLETGYMRYANAGHEHAILLDAAGGVTLLDAPGGPALGIDESAVYGYGERRLNSDNGLLLYTDGVTEAMNADGEVFGIGRLVALTQATPFPADPGLLSEEIVRQVRAFEPSAEFSDDLTLLACWYRRSSGEAR